mgnify:CR=1 FL=1
MFVQVSIHDFNHYILCYHWPQLLCDYFPVTGLKTVETHEPKNYKKTTYNSRIITITVVEECSFYSNAMALLILYPDKKDKKDKLL